MSRRSFGRRGGRSKSSDKVDLNLAAMLDMAFQLLTFFILTFRPAPTEGQLAVNIPTASHPQPAPVEPAAAPPQDPAGPVADVNPFETLTIHVDANEAGVPQRVRIGTRVVANNRWDEAAQAHLSRELRDALALGAFDRVQIIADGRLAYSDLVKTVEICTRQKLSDGSPLHKIAFVQRDNAVQRDELN
ncbi:MAG: biopolymer transporter ExbD [Planctomycetaceae bacterium]|nr:biopolymer transporter ExbD [Planctomycetaceae bacterium]